MRRRVGLADHRLRHERDTLALGAFDQRHQQGPVLDHMGERLARFDVAIEGEEHRPHRVAQMAVSDAHVEDRLHFLGDGLPHADGLEQPSRRRHDRGGARIIDGASKRRICHRHAVGRAERLLERDRERQAGKAGTADQHVAAAWILGHAPPSLSVHIAIVRRLETRASSRSTRHTGAPQMAAAIQDLLTILDLEQLEVNLFRGRSPQVGWQRVFGGQVIGQALVAASRTVDVADRPPHSLHAYFLLPGDPKVPIIYEVDRIRDGTSFTTRRVVAIQHGQAIFTMAVSFHRDEPGMSHQARIPEVAKPEQLPNEADIKERVLPLMPDPVRRYYERERPIEWRPVELDRYLGKKIENGRFHVWIRATAKLPDEPAIHQCVLAYASDMLLLDSALIPHGRTVFEKTLMAASLDHALWFHRPFRADEWLLYAHDSPNLAGSRGFSRGLIFASDGTLVASVAQEGLLRERSFPR